MTETVAPTPPDSPPPPTAPQADPPAKSPLWVWTAVPVAAVLFIAGFAVVNGAATTHPATETPTSTGMCDPGVATAYTDGSNGVVINVNTPSPAVVYADVIGGMGGQWWHLTQQVTYRNDGARFWVGDANPVDSVSISVWDKSLVSNGDTTHCEVPVTGANR